MTALDDVVESLRRDRLSKPWAAFVKQNPGVAPLVVAYLDGGPRPSDAQLGENHYAHARVRAEDSRRGLVPAPPPPQSIMLPGSRVTLDAGETAAWCIYDSPTSQIVAGKEQGSGDGHRIICWDRAGGMPSAFYSGKLLYFRLGFRLIEGVPGRLWNAHTQPDDKPYGWTPPGAGGGVSPFALDYKADGRGLHMRVESEVKGAAGGDTDVPNYMVLSTAEMEDRRRQWVWIWGEIGLGRDETPPSGSLRLWVSGEDTPRVVARDINTHYFGQHQVTLWEGAYHYPKAPSRCVIEHAATSLGRTPRECFEDVPKPYAREGRGNDFGGPGSAIATPNVDAGEVPVPTELRW